MAHTSLADKGCRVIATIINLTTPEMREKIFKRMASAGRLDRDNIYTLPYDTLLAAPTLQEISDCLEAEKLYGGDLYEEHVYDYVIAAMQLQHVLEYIKFGSLIIVPGDRADVIIACLASVISRSMPYISGMILTGGFKPEGRVKEMIEGFEKIIPILSVPYGTYQTTRRINQIPSGISPRDERKIAQAMGLFEENVDSEELAGKIFQAGPNAVSPKMFQHTLIERARENRKRIVLPEGEDERILLAAENILTRKIADITLLGDGALIKAEISRLGLNMEDVTIINPLESPSFKDYVRTF